MMTDGMPAAEALTRFERDGFTGAFGAREGGLVQCFTCHQTSRADEVELRALIRAEGESDPADMVAVAALVCPRCGARGTVVLSYGPEAPTEDDDVLRDLHDHRVASGIIPAATDPVPDR